MLTPCSGSVGYIAVIWLPPSMSPSLSGVLPWLNRITAVAPAASAFVALVTNGQVPRWTSAMRPAMKPVKSSGSHPLLDVLPGPSSRSTASTSAVTFPGLLRCIRWQSPAMTTGSSSLNV